MSQLNNTTYMQDWKKKIILFLISQNISLFGSNVVSFSIIWYVTLSTTSGIWIMMVTICSMVPQVIISLFGGVWADRYNRKTLIMLSDAFIAFATLILAITFLLGHRRLELVLIGSIIRSVGAGIQIPAVNAIYPQLAPQEKMMKIQGINQTLNSILMLLSPAIGGLLLGTLGIVSSFFADISTAILAIFIMSQIHVEKLVQAEKAMSIFEDLKKGVVYAFKHTQIRRIIFCCLFSFFLITPASVLSPLLIVRNYGDEVWRLTTNEIVWTVGSLIGGIFVSIKGKFKDKVRTIAFGIISFGILFTFLGISWNYILFLVNMGIAGFFMPIVFTTQTVYIQEITEPSVLGRVFSIVQLISAGAMPIAILFFGPLADFIKIEYILLVTGGLLVLVGIIYGWTRSENSGVVLETKE